MAATPPKMQPAPNGKPFFSGFAPCRELNFRIQSVKIPLHCTDIFLPSARKSYSNLLEILLLPRKAVLSYSLLILLQSLIFSGFRHFVHYRSVSGFLPATDLHHAEISVSFPSAGFDIPSIQPPRFIQMC